MSKAFSLTLGMLKPDLFIHLRNYPFSQLAQVKERKIIHDLLEAKGFKVERQTFKQLTLEEAERFYQEHRGKFFYQRLVSFMVR